MTDRRFAADDYFPERLRLIVAAVASHSRGADLQRARMEDAISDLSG